MHQGIRDTLAYHRNQRKTWLVVRDKMREPKPRAQGRTVRYVPQPLPPTRGEQLWRASAAMRGQLQHVICVLGVGILSFGVLIGIGIGLYHVAGLLLSLVPSPGPEALSFPAEDMIFNPHLAFERSLQRMLPLMQAVCGGGLLAGIVMVGMGYSHGISVSLAMVGTALALAVCRDLP